MKSLAHGVVKWFGMEGDIESMVKDCHQCQVHCNSPVPAHAGPFLDKQFLVVVVDAHLKWLVGSNPCIEPNITDNYLYSLRDFHH